MSIEALAMAGADYIECGIKLETWEQSGVEQPPAYLLAEEDVRDDCMEWGINLEKWDLYGVQQPPEYLLVEEDGQQAIVVKKSTVDDFLFISEKLVATSLLAMANAAAPRTKAKPSKIGS